MSRGSPQALLFDKDGTLFDFQASWGSFTARFLRDLSQGDDLLFDVLAEAIGFDDHAGHLLPDSPVIAGTSEDSVDIMLPHLPVPPVRSELIAKLNTAATTAEMQPAVPLVPLLDELIARGLQLGVATNDGEAPAYAHLEREGIRDRFSFIAGYDSGFGGKPAPGQLLAFAEHVGVPTGRIAMIGDSSHDLLAGRAAGMITVGVLTGPATRTDLAPLADVVLPDIGALPDWLDRSA